MTAMVVDFDVVAVEVRRAVVMVVLMVYRGCDGISSGFWWFLG